MRNKVWDSPAAVVADIASGATIMVGGFAEAGKPHSLLVALRDRGIGDLTFIANGVGRGDGTPDLVMFLERRLVRKVYVTFYGPLGKPDLFSRLRESGEVEAEMVPQGTFAERIRAGGAGIPAFFTPTAAGTLLGEGKETRSFNGHNCVLETALTADVALIRAERADRLGNLEYRRTARNFNPDMAAAARLTIAEVSEIVEVGEIDAEAVGTPGVYVDRIVRATHPKVVRR